MSTPEPFEKSELLKRLLKEIGEKYAGLKPAGAWTGEKEAVRGYLIAIAEELQGWFTLDKALGVGGAGIVIRVIDNRLTLADDHPVYSVLKFPRPVEDKVDDLNRILHGETRLLRDLRHQNLIRILTLGTTKNDTPFFVMEDLSGPEDADEWLQENPSLEGLLRIFEGAVRGLRHLHEHDPAIAHLDIKPANIFVSASSVVVADLGFAKSMSGDSKTINVGGTAGYMHPDFEQLLEATGKSGLDKSDSKRQMQTKPIERDSLKKEWDLYSLGVTLLVLLRVLEIADPAVVRAYEFRYLKLMSYRMLGAQLEHSIGATTRIPGYGKSDETKTPLVSREYLGMDLDAYSAIAYRSISDVSEDLEKLTGSSDLLRAVPEMHEFPREVIQAASHSSTPFTERIRGLLQSVELRRLSRIDQLGLIRLIYPVASHSRLEHSLGTLAMSVRFARALYSDPLSPIFRQLMRKEDLELLLVLCLVHDIGHYPLAHDLEEVDLELFGHERRTRALFARDNSEVATQVESDFWSPGILERLDRILDKENPPLSIQEMLAKSIIDGPVDADKIDYLLRDSENLRLQYGRGVDVEKLLQSMTVVVTIEKPTPDDPPQVRARIGITDKGRIPAESVAFARYSLYGAVYWHRTHRTMKAMLNRLGFEVLATAGAREGAKTKEGESKRDIFFNEFYAFLDEIEGSGAQFLIQETATGPYLDVQIEKVILWLSRKAEKPGYAELAKRILNRDLYARILVLTRARHGSEVDWTKVEKLFGVTGQNWDGRRKAHVELQTSVRKRLVQLLAENAVPDELKDRVVALDALLATESPILLIDFPPKKVGSDVGLQYLREPEAWHKGSKDNLRVDDVEDSSMWKQLSTEYAVSLGKLRIYCDPDWADLVGRLVTISELRKMLNDAIKKHG